MNSNREIDDIDVDIIRVLQQNARLSVRELAAKVHRSPTPVFERLRRLEAEGVITAYSARIDMMKVGRGFTVFCNVRLRHINTAIHNDFAAEVHNMPEVVECYNISGEFDYMLKVQVPDMKSYRSFVTERMGNLPMIDSVQSVFVMDEIKQSPVTI
ncbi:MAG: Lrp/AsnC family transcriptional regulator [Muribaculaceae bacterium]|nr:Lrp/AsnC family transcriptional regulator [Muribaculaceae bacterium]MDE5929474.1 Lrp/AsnC family transcriptional regulator [Muribaculaceae bacterium]MDE6131020.1 Lrp/AsnC family transcriptional regulator [Muribaculaceae bacterium]